MMNIKKWFNSKKPWLRGGIIAVMICIVLYPFYFLVFGLIMRSFARDAEWLLTLPVISGHYFTMDDGPKLGVGMFCKATKTVCNEWSSAYEPGGVPWPADSMPEQPMIGGQQGYCLNQETIPLASCADRVEFFSFLVRAFLLVVIYGVIGAIIGWHTSKLQEKIRKRKAK